MIQLCSTALVFLPERSYRCRVDANLPWIAELSLSLSQPSKPPYLLVHPIPHINHKIYLVFFFLFHQRLWAKSLLKLSFTRLFHGMQECWLILVTSSSELKLGWVPAQFLKLHLWLQKTILRFEDEFYILEYFVYRISNETRPLDIPLHLKVRRVFQPSGRMENPTPILSTPWTASRGKKRHVCHAAHF